MRPAATPIQILTLRERVESLMRAKPKAATNAMMALLLRVRRSVAPRKSAGQTQGVLLRARCAARRVAMERRVAGRKQGVGIAGVLPMVESAAAMNSVRLRATERMDALSGAS